jgi:hypothetical protein
MKDKSLKDDIRYQIQFFNEINNTWAYDLLYMNRKGAREQIKYYRSRDKRYGINGKYRILKLTIKKEVVG